MKKAFIHDDFLLETETAKILFHEYASHLPVIDYHSHLDPQIIVDDIKYDNLSQVSLYDDHYKWRAMRANGIPEEFITGNASDWDKFRSWAETVPNTLRNPLYHWTHLELCRYFGVYELLNANSAKGIYDHANSLLSTDEFSVKNILLRSKVEVLCTTNDPIDDLQQHQKIRESNFQCKVLPTWRPDQVLQIDHPEIFNSYIEMLGASAGTDITSVNTLLDALQQRHDHFESAGCKLSDHGISEFYSDEYSEIEIKNIFKKVSSGSFASESEIRKYKSFMLYELALMDDAKGWVQQYHFGALRNNNSRMYQKLGRDAGFDSIGDRPTAESLSAFLDRLDEKERLAKTILYNLNPTDNDMLATMIGNFQDGSFPGKIQFGPGWWFLDHKNGMEDQMNSLSNHGLLAHFIGMLTDSRSILSYVRHEYFRRILCNLLGTDMEKGLLPDDIELSGMMVQNICYHNARRYFNF